ncbi:hypothetical protein, partial [Serratia marcescens]|uniref:hypothetical protein n=1 Tax=Serratia marcescens TaxID=615 RepID=UPI0013DC0996
GIVYATASIISCLAIVELNLSTLPVDTWTDKIRKLKNKLYEQQAELERMGKERQQILKQEADEVYEYEHSLIRFRAGN